MITLEQVLYIVPILALSASITYYAITIRNQNKTRQAQLFMQTFYQDRQDFTHSYSKLRWVYDWNDFDDFWEKYGAETNLDEWEKILSFWGYFESVGILVKDKLLTVDYVDKAIGGFILFTWQKYRSIVLEARNRWKSPTLLESFEYLYDLIVEYRT